MKPYSTRAPNVASLVQTPGARTKHSTFPRGHRHTTAIFDDSITPIFCQEILPGDTMKCVTSSFARLNPTLTPVMDNVWQDIHFFFVPNRLTWENWERFCGQQDDPGDSTDFLIPFIPAPGTTGWQKFSNADYLGLPILNPAVETVSALPLRAIGLIYNQWYRDENIQNSLVVPKGDGPDNPTAVGYPNLPMKRNRKHDYFTSALPWPQKGPSVPVPLSGMVPVISNGEIPSFRGTTSSSQFGNLSTNASRELSLAAGTFTTETLEFNQDQTGLQADLSYNTETTINALRQAFSLQSLYERDARGGTRYTEINWAHFGVISPDARLQRPEFLGGGSSLCIMNPLAQTSESETTPQGNLAGNGITMDTVSFTKSFSEHGYVIGFVSYRGQTSYSQGIPRHFSRKTRWDFYWPDLANIGEQAILKKELLATGTSLDQEVLGYTERYAEYKTAYNYMTSTMRPGIAGSTDYWHLGPEFADAELSSIIPSNTPFERVLTVPTEPTFLCDFYFDLKHTRPMGTNSIPGGLTRF